MAKNPYCSICGKYHFDAVSYFDKDKNETVYLCSSAHQAEYIKKKNNPGYKTSYDVKQDQFMQEVNERNAAAREKRRQKLDDIEQFYENNPDGDYNAQRGGKKSNKGFFSFDDDDKESEADKRRRKEVEEEDAKFYAWLRKFWYIWIPGAIIAGVLFYFLFIKDGGLIPDPTNEDTPVKEQIESPVSESEANKEVSNSEPSTSENKSQQENSTDENAQENLQQESQEEEQLDPEYVE
jgi:uncharacterized Zn finger protein (UPF0148 family)